MGKITYPITIQKIIFSADEYYKNRVIGGSCGDMVAVRPCAEEYEDKTFLGVLLGDFPISIVAQHDDKKETLTISRAIYNPAIFIPEKNSIVFGCESWWGVIKDETELRRITDEDIKNVWYVKALKQLSDTKDNKVP